MSRRDSDESIFQRIRERLEEARCKHPEGTTFEDVMSEFYEFMDEEPDTERECDEALDLIVTCFRIIKGGDRCMTESTRIQFKNLLDESRYAFMAGDFQRSELILAEAQVLVTHKQRLKEMEGAA